MLFFSYPSSDAEMSIQYWIPVLALSNTENLNVIHRRLEIHYAKYHMVY